MPWSHRRSRLTVRLGRWPRLALAGLCLLLAVVSAVSAHGAPAQSTETSRPVVAAAHPLAAGRVVSADDVHVARWPSRLIPAHTLNDTAALVGKRLAAPVATGEAITTARLLGRDLTTGLPAGMLAVPVSVSGLHIADLVHLGDRVELVATPRSDGIAADVDASDEPSADVRGDAQVLASRLLVLAVAADREAGTTELVVAADRGTALQITRAATASVLTAFGDPP